MFPRRSGPKCTFPRCASRPTARIQAKQCALANNTSRMATFNFANCKVIVNVNGRTIEEGQRRASLKRNGRWQRNRQIFPRSAVTRTGASWGRTASSATSTSPC